MGCLNSEIHARDPAAMSWSRVMTHIFFEVDKSARNVMKNRHMCAPSEETILWLKFVISISALFVDFIAFVFIAALTHSFK